MTGEKNERHLHLMAGTWWEEIAVVGASWHWYWTYQNQCWWCCLYAESQAGIGLVSGDHTCKVILSAYIDFLVRLYGGHSLLSK